MFMLINKFLFDIIFWLYWKQFEPEQFTFLTCTLTADILRQGKSWIVNFFNNLIMRNWFFTCTILTLSSMIFEKSQAKDLILILFLIIFFKIHNNFSLKKWNWKVNFQFLLRDKKNMGNLEKFCEIIKKTSSYVCY